MRMAPFEKIVDQMRGVFELGGRLGGPPDKVPPGGEGLFPESVPTRFETVATPLFITRDFISLTAPMRHREIAYTCKVAQDNFLQHLSRSKRVLVVF